MLHQGAPRCGAPFGQRVRPALARSVHTRVPDPGAATVVFPLGGGTYTRPQAAKRL